MEPEATVRRTAEVLERHIATAHHDLLGADASEEHAGALVDMLHYVALLREAASGTATRYSFKLELPDGRWDVAEQPLQTVPRVGDVVRLDNGGRWKILRTQLVRPLPRAKPPRAIFVCAPAA